MNFLLDELPKSVEIDGRKYAIDTDYTTSIRYELLLMDSSFDEGEKARLALNLYYDNLPNNLEAAMQKIYWFYAGGDIPKKGAKTGGNAKRIYSFEHDSEYIYAAFLADYGIDLQNTNLHWWKFKALFQSLREDNLINKIMGYRSMDISKLKGEEKRYYQKLQKQFAIPLPKSEQEKLDEMNKILLNGGDIASIL